MVEYQETHAEDAPFPLYKTVFPIGIANPESQARERFMPDQNQVCIDDG